MSFTIRVPAGVPSVHQSSSPWSTSAAKKNVCPPAYAKSRAPDPSVPARMSFSRIVPAAVPSVR
jgi:hypothetical protein